MYNFPYIETTTTFVNDSHALCEQIQSPGGVADIIAHWLIQFFDTPGVGLAITAALLLAVAHFMGGCVKQVTGSSRWSWLMCLPVVPQFFMHYINFGFFYHYAGTVSLLIMAVTLRLLLMMQNHTWRHITAVFATVAVWWTCGSAAMLFALLYFICTQVQNSRIMFTLSNATALLPTLTMLAIGVASLYCDKAYTLQQTIGPEAYYSPDQRVPSIIYWSWGMMMIACVLAALLSHLGITQSKKKSVKWALPIVQIAAACAFFATSWKMYVDPENEFFKELYTLARQQLWSDITDRCQQHDMNNVLFQNIAYMAWAEQGQLDNNVGRYPSHDFYSIIVPADRSPLLSAMLSDVYYSMGHISQAQRFAFEANQSFGNQSPAMLQRLVDTNIIYGQYRVAEKYIAILEKTRRYANWARERRSLLDNDDAVAQHHVLGMKRRCLPEQTTVTGMQGIDDDLKQIMHANPDHSITKSYLRAIYMLNGQPYDEAALTYTEVADSTSDSTVANSIDAQTAATSLY